MSPRSSSEQEPTLVDGLTAAPAFPRLAKLIAFFRQHASTQMTQDAGQATTTELSARRTNFASSRNMMAADRTLMAWVRTALSMISFGFTIYKLLQGFEESGTHFGHAGSPRTMGLFLTGMGTVSMLLGTAAYLATLRELRRYQPFPIWRASFVMALFMSATGLFLFVAIIAKAL